MFPSSHLTGSTEDAFLDLGLFRFHKKDCVRTTALGKAEKNWPFMTSHGFRKPATLPNLE
jgi:hypothetical protein